MNSMSLSVPALSSDARSARMPGLTTYTEAHSSAAPATKSSVARFITANTKKRPRLGYAILCLGSRYYHFAAIGKNAPTRVCKKNPPFGCIQ